MEAALEGRWAVVTGGSGGIGRSMAIALHERGMRVVVGDLRPPTAEAPLPAGVQYIETDVTEPEQLERCPPTGLTLTPPPLPLALRQQAAGRQAGGRAGGRATFRVGQ